MGVHGAGLANCAFANPNALMFEFQSWHNYGFDGFSKVSEVADGLGDCDVLASLRACTYRSCTCLVGRIFSSTSG
jgi:hypothetical protein